MTHLQDTLKQFTLENCTETPALQQPVAFKTSHVCTGDTLLLDEDRHNRKSVHRCAHPVEDETSLWKALEKRKTIHLIHVLAYLESFFGHGQHVAFASYPHI
jgi:hypothetical protein